MEQKLLADIELDVQELKCLMKSFSQEPNSTLTELLKRNIMQMQGRLEQLLQKLNSDREIPLASITTEKIVKNSSPIIEKSSDKEIVTTAIESFSIEEASAVVKETVEEVVKATTIVTASSSLAAEQEEQEITELKKEELPVVKEFFVVEDLLKNEEVNNRKKEEVNKVKEPLIKEDPFVIKETPIIENTSIIETMEEKELVVEEGDNDLPAHREEIKLSVLGESIQISKGLRSSISLNDSFRFSRELFDGDGSLMNRVIEQISVMNSYKAAMVFLTSKVNIIEENETHNDFLELLKKYFNQSA
ncbi:hypothetical protein [Bacteroides sp.]|uniref:hypothetical protein n=1 Tax=Bacteroides sp. TaxID=29523 RepID=UPI00260F59FB|nr:hypothetical protein [Bacteroides sp.]MDD3040013.1 hypothetical protein [Bacteroides sp.]